MAKTLFCCSNSSCIILYFFPINLVCQTCNTHLLNSFLPSIPVITNFSEAEIWLKLYDDDSASGDDQIGVTNTFYLIDPQVIPEDLPVSDIPATFSSSHTISLNNGDGVLKVNFNWTHE